MVTQAIKVCAKCRESKPRTAFARHYENADGLQSYCKICSATARIAYATPESRQRDRDRVNAWRRTPAGRRATSLAKRAYRLRNRNITRAWKKFHRARNAGLIVPQPCERCGDPRAEAHHDDYGKPLDVRWLCRKHHVEHHYPKEAA